MTRLLKKASTFVVTAIAASVMLAGCGGGSDGDPTHSGERPAEETGAVTIKFVWWGNENRNRLTQEVLAKFKEVYPNITVVTETADSTSYWEMLSAYENSGQMPDVIQMDERYLSTYGLGESLMDLESISADLTKFDQNSIDSGRVDGTLYGATFGMSVPVVLANPAIFEKAGVELPDDMTWTWDEFSELAQEIGAAGGSDFYGSTSMIGVDGALKVWLRQHGVQQFTDDGIGFTAEDVTAYYQYWLDLQTAGGTPPATVSVEEMAATPSRGLFAANRAGMTVQWTNDVAALDVATGGNAVLLRPPTTTGKAADANLWLRSSMYLSISANTQHANASLKLVEFLLNNADAGVILGTERGISANSDVRAVVESTMTEADKKVVAFIESVTPELGDPSTVPLPGGGTSATMQQRYGRSVLLEESSPAVAASGYVEELKKEMGLS